MTNYKELEDQIRIVQIFIIVACLLISASFISFEFYLQRNIKMDRVFLYTIITYPVCLLARLINLVAFGRPYQADDSSGYIILDSVTSIFQNISCLSTLFYILAIQYVEILLRSSNPDDFKKLTKRHNFVTINLLSI